MSIHGPDQRFQEMFSCGPVHACFLEKDHYKQNHIGIPSGTQRVDLEHLGHFLGQVTANNKLETPSHLRNHEVAGVVGATKGHYNQQYKGSYATMRVDAAKVQIAADLGMKENNTRNAKQLAIMAARQDEQRPISIFSA